MFDQWFRRSVQAKQADLLNEGAAPHMQDDFQRHLISSARGLLYAILLDELRSGNAVCSPASHLIAPCRSSQPEPS